MTIRYKVVRILRGKRFSAALSRENEFSMQYPKGETVIAPEGTLGLMTFDNKKNARIFMSNCLGPSLTYEIIKVEGMGRGYKPKYVMFDNYGHGILAFKKLLRDHGLKRVMQAYMCAERIAPKGTICYKAVKVIE